MVVYKSILDPTYWNHTGPTFEAHYNPFTLFNLIKRPPAKEELSPDWPKVVSPVLETTPAVSMGSATPAISTESPMTPVTLITSTTTPSPSGPDLTSLILTVLTALCTEKNSTDTACVRARTQLQSLSLSKGDIVEENPANQYDPVVLQNLLVSLINDQAAVNDRERQGRQSQSVQGFSWSVFLQAVRGINRFVKTISNSGDVVALLEDWLRRPAQKSVSTDQLKVFFDLFAMEALSALQRDVKLLEVSLFVLIGVLIALVLMLGVGWSVMSIRACKTERKAAKVRRQKSDADILLRNLQRSRRQQIMESQF